MKITTKNIPNQNLFPNGVEKMFKILNQVVFSKIFEDIEVKIKIIHSMTIKLT